MPDLLSIKNLAVSIEKESIHTFLLRDVSLEVKKGEITALVGQSGSGKTTTALAVLGLLAFQIPGVKTEGGVFFQENDILTMSDKERGDIMGRRITFIPQSAYSTLNPFLSIRRQAVDIAARGELSPEKAVDRFHMLLSLLHFPDPDFILKAYPYQLSGGMRQRALVAMALLNEPDLLVADEPTTAVDRTNQVKVLDLIRSVCDERGMGALVITHDMTVAARIADFMTVLLSGLVMEAGNVEHVLRQPLHPYTADLLTSLYRVDDKPVAHRPETSKSGACCPFMNRCGYAEKVCGERVPEPIRTSNGSCVRCLMKEKPPLPRPDPSGNQVWSLSGHAAPLITVRDLSVRYESDLTLRSLFFKSKNKNAVNHLSFDVLPGQCIGIVGESGAGKTTAMKAATRLIPLQNGTVTFEGIDLTRMKYGALKKYRARMQMLFQNPDASLNPKMRIRDILLEPVKLHQSYPDRMSIERATADLIAQLDLEPRLLNRFPGELSHGQKQRAAIAKALLLNPALLFADEPVSAVDPHIRSRILGLFRNRQKQGMALVMISHDLEIVSIMSSYLLVMYRGNVVECGPSEKVYDHPAHPYTKTLISSLLTTDPEQERARRSKPSLFSDMEKKPLLGCPYYAYCNTKKDICENEEPTLKEFNKGHWSACFAVNV
ncbi:MAG: ATP-binding cassette domain-containing protein [Deltaproteobacteria bacterium]|nr:ATP-binding cassette domain-containing protein [Deltaproteobacteria bacterium]